MRSGIRRGLAVTAVASLALAACGDGGAPADEPRPTEAATDGAGEIEDPSGDEPQAGDPNEQVEDGVFRGVGVVLPVPDGWTLDPAAFAQGVVVATSEDGTQQLTARAVDTSEAEATGQPVDLDTLIEATRQLGEADVDEEVELEGARRAHRLTYLNLPPQQEGAPESSGTIVIAEDGAGLVGEFTFVAASADYDETFESVLIEGAGFDADSEPPAAPAVPQPPPEG